MNSKTLLALALVLLLSCQEKEQGGGGKSSSFSLATSEIKVSAETLSDQFVVKSDCGWTVQLGEPCDWLSVNKDSHPASGKEDQTRVILSFTENESFEDRSTFFYVVPDDAAVDAVRVDVTQRGVEKYLRVKNLPSGSIGPAGGSFTLTVESSLPWKITPGTGSAALFSCRPSSGKGKTTVDVQVAANSTDASRKGVLNFTSEFVDPVKVEFSQGAVAKDASFSVAVPAKTAYIDPAVFSCFGATHWVSLSTSLAWTASVGAETTASGVSLPVTSGTGNVDKFEICVGGANTDLDRYKVVAVDFTLPGGKVVKKYFTQQRASVMTLEFRTQDDSSTAYWPFDGTPVTTTGVNNGTGTYTAGGFSFGWRATDDCIFEPGTKWGWRVGRGTGDYIETPAVPGRSLKRLTIAEANGNTDPKIVDTGGEVVAGGDSTESSAAKAGGSFATAKGTLITWDLTGTQAGASYRLRTSSGNTLRIKFLELEYE